MGSVCCVAANSYVGNRGISMDKMSLGLGRGPPPQNGSFPASLRSANSELGATSSMIPPPLMATSPMIQSPSDVSLASPVSVEVFSTCSNDLATGSHYASSEGGWSINAFCELVAQSQRESWSFDSEHLDSEQRRLSGCSSSRFSFSPCVDQQTCGNCSKLLTERSTIARFDLPIAAVLSCGHVYHLETMTSETEKYDPIVSHMHIGEKQVAKLSRKSLKAEAELKAKN